MKRLLGVCLPSVAATALACCCVQAQNLLAWTGQVQGGQAQNSSGSFLQQLQKGSEEASQGNISAAEADIKAAIALDPGRADGWYELGSVLGQAADFPGAEAAFRRAIQVQPDLAKAHFSLALTLVANPQNKLDWAGAIAECREALKYQPEYPEALNLMGTGLASAGQTDEAIAALQRAIAMDPALAEAHFHLALAFESKGLREDAAKEYQAAIAARGTYPEATSGWGKLLFQTGKTTEAEARLDEALCLNPDLTDAHYTLARLLRSLKRDKEAAVEFAEAKELIDRPANGVQSSQESNEGLELASKGDLAGATAILRKAIALKPDYGVPHLNLGLILADSGDMTGAAQELTKAISLLPGQYRAWFDLGRVLERTRGIENLHRAVAALAWAAHLAPSDAAIASELASAEAMLHAAEQPNSPPPHPEPILTQPTVGAVADTAPDHLTFARELAHRRDFQGATGESLRALSLDPAGLEARLTLAQAYVQLGDRDRAMLEYANILRSAPGNAEAQLAMGKIRLQQGDYEDASKHLRLALQSQPDSAEVREALDRAEKLADRH